MDTSTTRSLRARSLRAQSQLAPARLAPRDAGYHMPAEWHPRSGTLVSWPVRPEAWLESLERAREGYAEVCRAIADFEPLILVARPSGAAASGPSAAEDARKRLGSAAEIWELPQDDSWIRDNGPTFLVDGRGNRAGVKWRFNAWGGKYAPFDADDALAGLILEKLSLERFDAPLVLEGGSIHSDGEGTILSTEECLLAPNRNPGLTKEEIEAFVLEYTGSRKLIWLDRGLWGDETDGHVDNAACFVRGALVLLQSAEEGSPNFKPFSENLRRLGAARDAMGRKLETAFIPEPPRRECRGEALTLSYINFYPVRGGLIVPVFGKDGSADMRRADDRALGILADLYPGRKIVGVDGMKIIQGGGNVHCITQQLPAPEVRDGTGDNLRGGRT